MFVASHVLLAVANSVLPLFDASPRLHSSLSPYNRWDVFHFIAIANAGYTYEHQWAFLPATPFLIRHLPFLPFLLLLLAADSARILHRLTRLHFPASPSFARLVLILSLFPSSPATLYFAPYAEPFFTHLSYRGMLYAAQESWLLATICFSLASSFRSNGIFLAGYLFWGLVVLPFLRCKQISLLRIAYSILLSVCVAAPMAYHNYAAYRLFCTSNAPPEWCTRSPPSIYTFVQAKYWNNGFLRYWSFAQIPNFIISAPPLILLLVFSVHHIKTTFLPILRSRISGERSTKILDSSITTIAITPHVIHSLVMCFTLLFFSNTQIILRLAAALPTLYWAAAWLFVQQSRWSRVWVWWSVIWGLISLALWVSFLPPA